LFDGGIGCRVERTGRVGIAMKRQKITVWLFFNGFFGSMLGITTVKWITGEYHPGVSLVVDSLILLSVIYCTFDVYMSIRKARANNQKSADPCR
jgi:hypothetical protein